MNKLGILVNQHNILSTLAFMAGGEMILFYWLKLCVCNQL